MKRVTRGLAVLAAVLMLLWQVVPIQQEWTWVATSNPNVEEQFEWVTQAGWTLWPELWEMLLDAPSSSPADPDTWQMLVFASCFVSGVLGVAAVAVVVWFGVPRLLRVGVAVVMTFALAGGPGLLAFLWFAEPPDPDHYRFFPSFLLWPAAVFLSWIAALLWAVSRGKEG